MTDQVIDVVLSIPESDRAEDIVGIQDAAFNAVNTYFERALRSVPEIDAYLQEIVKRAP